MSEVVWSWLLELGTVTLALALVFKERLGLGLQISHKEHEHPSDTTLPPPPLPRDLARLSEGVRGAQLLALLAVRSPTPWQRAALLCALAVAVVSPASGRLDTLRWRVSARLGFHVNWMTGWYALSLGALLVEEAGAARLQWCRHLIAVEAALHLLYEPRFFEAAAHRRQHRVHLPLHLLTAAVLLYLHWEGVLYAVCLAIPVDFLVLGHSGPAVYLYEGEEGRRLWLRVQITRASDLKRHLLIEAAICAGRPEHLGRLLRDAADPHWVRFHMRLLAAQVGFAVATRARARPGVDRPLPETTAQRLLSCLLAYCPSPAPAYHAHYGALHSVLGGVSAYAEYPGVDALVRRLVEEDATAAGCSATCLSLGRVAIAEALRPPAPSGLLDLLYHRTTGEGPRVAAATHMLAGTLRLWTHSRAMRAAAVRVILRSAFGSHLLDRGHDALAVAVYEGMPAECVRLLAAGDGDVSMAALLHCLQLSGALFRAASPRELRLRAARGLSGPACPAAFRELVRLCRPREHETADSVDALLGLSPAPVFTHLLLLLLLLLPPTSPHPTVLRHLRSPAMLEFYSKEASLRAPMALVRLCAGERQCGGSVEGALVRLFGGDAAAGPAAGPAAWPLVRRYRAHCRLLSERILQRRLPRDVVLHQILPLLLG